MRLDSSGWKAPPEAVGGPKKAPDPFSSTCSAWLSTGGADPSSRIAAWLTGDANHSGNLFGHASFVNDEVDNAIHGTQNADLKYVGVPDYFRMTVNDKGAFFNEKFLTGNKEKRQLGPGLYTGGRIHAQALIAIHELAHGLVPVDNFPDDAASSKVSGENDKHVYDNCQTQIESLAGVSPNTLEFAAPLNTTSESQTVHLTGKLSTNMTIVIGFTDSSQTDFSFTTNCGSSLGKGNQCEVNVTFHPQSAGMRTATLAFTDSAANSPQTVVVTGNRP